MSLEGPSQVEIKSCEAQQSSLVHCVCLACVLNTKCQCLCTVLRSVPWLVSDNGTAWHRSLFILPVKREAEIAHPDSPAEYPLVLKDSHNGSGMLCVVFRGFAKFCSPWSTSCCLHPFSLCFSKRLALYSMSADCLLLSLCRRCGGAVSCTMVTAAPASTGLVHL